MIDRLTAMEYDSVPNPGSVTYKLSTAQAVFNAQGWLYRLAKARGEKVSIQSDLTAQTLTITKKGYLPKK